MHNVNEFELSVLHLEHNCALGGVAISVEGNNTGSSHEIFGFRHCVPYCYGIDYSCFLNGNQQAGLY
jgi:hypothetical protein